MTEKLGSIEWKGRFHYVLAYSYIKSGNPKEALEECDRALSIFIGLDDLKSQRRTLLYKGLAYLEIKKMDEAQRTANKLKEILNQGLNKISIRYYHYLMGMIELEKNNLSKAV